MCVCVCARARAHMQSGIFLNYKKNEILLFATAWIDLEVLSLVKLVRQKKTNTICFTYMKNPESKINEQYNKKIISEN